MKTSQNLSVDSSSPQAWIAIQKNRQKVYVNSGKSQVYLKNGQEFQIELFNPSQTKYLAKIKINGKYTSESGLILNPGQRYFLDRFIDEDRKMSFSTYEVEDTNLVKKAIEKNGLVEVQFYPETSYSLSSNYWYQTSNTYYTNTVPYFGNSITYTTGPNFSAGTINSTSGTLSNGTLSGSTTLYNCIPNCILNTSGNTNLATDKFINTTKKVETGRVEKGEKSDQNFQNEYGSFNSIATCVSIVQIVPKSQKPIETHEIRNYCSGCGIRVKKQTWKFCPNCGEKF